MSGVARRWWQRRPGSGGAHGDLFEVIVSALSLWFAVILWTYRHSAAPGPLPHELFAVIVLCAALLKLAGMLAGRRWLRLAGLLVGAFFWGVLSFVLWRTVAHGISWGGYAIIMVGQLWRAYELARGGTGER